MGYEDRDWFREDHARKNGLVYDRATGRYRPASWLVLSFRLIFIRRPPKIRKWVSLLFFCLGLILVCYAFYKTFLLSSSTRKPQSVALSYQHFRQTNGAPVADPVSALRGRGMG